MTKTAELIPPDLKRCQAEKPNGQGPFTLGGGHKMIRCDAKPMVIATETKPGKDGAIGSMSLCGDCMVVMQKQLPRGFATFGPIKT